MIKTMMPSSRFEFLLVGVKDRLLSSGHFNGDEAELEEWAGDVLSDTIEYALNKVGIEIDWGDY